MKKFLIIIFFFLSTNVFAFEKGTNFTIEEFKKAQNEGKTIVVNSWNKFCITDSIIDNLLQP